MRVRLTKKFANVLNGVDLTHARVGRLMTVDDGDGEMLIAEGWAVPHLRARTTAVPRAEAADKRPPTPSPVRNLKLAQPNRLRTGQRRRKN